MIAVMHLNQTLDARCLRSDDRSASLIYTDMCVSQAAYRCPDPLLYHTIGARTSLVRHSKFTISISTMVTTHRRKKAHSLRSTRRKALIAMQQVDLACHLPPYLNLAHPSALFPSPDTTGEKHDIVSTMTQQLNNKRRSKMTGLRKRHVVVKVCFCMPVLTTKQNDEAAQGLVVQDRRAESERGRSMGLA